MYGVVFVKGKVMNSIFREITVTTGLTRNPHQQEVDAGLQEEPELTHPHNELHVCRKLSVHQYCP